MTTDREKRIQEYVEKGFWTEDLTVDFWDRNAEECPDETAIVDSRARLTWSEAGIQIDRIALGLLERGFNKNDVMLVQMFNSVDLVLIRLACEKAGIYLAVVAPTFRHAELQFVLNKVEARGVFIPRDFRGQQSLPVTSADKPEEDGQRRQGMDQRGCGPSLRDKQVCELMGLGEEDCQPHADRNQGGDFFEVRMFFYVIHFS